MDNRVTTHDPLPAHPWKLGYMEDLNKHRTFDQFIRYIMPTWSLRMN